MIHYTTSGGKVKVGKMAKTRIKRGPKKCSKLNKKISSNKGTIKNNSSEDEMLLTEMGEADDSCPFLCKLCGKRFQHSSALGGHISKAHPGKSDAYNHKKRVRETRELERDLHRNTMQIYQEYMKE